MLYKSSQKINMLFLPSLLLFGFLAQETVQTLSNKYLEYSLRDPKTINYHFNGKKHFFKHKPNATFAKYRDYTSLKNGISNLYYLAKPERRLLNSKLMNINRNGVPNLYRLAKPERRLLNSKLMNINRNNIPNLYHLTKLDRRLLNSKLMDINRLPVNLWKNISLNKKPTGNYEVAPTLNAPIDLEKEMETEYNELKRNSFQLTDDVRPLHYFLAIKSYYWGNGTFEGEMRVVLKADQETSFITLHYHELNFVNESIQVS